VLRFERVFRAPPRLVFAAVTEARLIRRWMCPESFEVAEAEADPRVGGRFRVAMRAPDGTVYRVAGEYLEVRPPEAVAFSWTWEPEHTMSGVETRIRVELSEHAEGTLFRMTHSGLPSEAERESHRAGWTGALKHLEALTESLPSTT
jgi:glutathione S-transferase